MNLLEMIKDAQTKIETYRYPDLDEVKGRLEEILQASERGNISGTMISNLYLDDKDLGIEVEYTNMGGHQTDYFSIPLKVLNSDDPVKAARIWGADTRLEIAKERLSAAEYGLKRAIENLDKRTKERNDLD